MPNDPYIYEDYGFETAPTEDGIYYKEDTGYYEGSYDDWTESEWFDAQARHYQHDDKPVDEAARAEEAENFDTVYATCLDAKTFRSYLPIVTLTDTAGDLSPGIASNGSSPTSKGKKGKIFNKKLDENYLDHSEVLNFRKNQFQADKFHIDWIDNSDENERYLCFGINTEYEAWNLILILSNTSYFRNVSCRAPCLCPIGR